MPSRGRRAGDALPRALARVLELWERCVAWQTPFSFVSALVPLVLMLVFVSDLIVGHAHLRRALVILWLTLYGIAALLPLAFGRRYPPWAGLATVALLESTSLYFLVGSPHLHAEVNALLELPIVALYLGWFFAGWPGRLGMLLSLATVPASILLNPHLGRGILSPLITGGTAVLMAVFCFGGARAVRRQGHAQAILDPLTAVLNRRGLVLLSPTLRRRAQQAGDPVTLAVIDFDDFKLLNERGGHSAGDAALVRTAREWVAAVGMRGVSARRGGLVARLGGDEFALLVRADDAGTEALLRRERAASAYAWTWGTTALAPDEDLAGAIARADAALYRAKRR